MVPKYPATSVDHRDHSLPDLEAIFSVPEGEHWSPLPSTSAFPASPLPSPLFPLTPSPPTLFTLPHTLLGLSA